MLAIEVVADDRGIEERGPVVEQQDWNLAQRIDGEYRLVAPGRAGLVVDHRQAVGEPSLVGEHQGLAGIGRMSLIEELHGRIFRSNGCRWILTVALRCLQLPGWS